MMGWGASSVVTIRALGAGMIPQGLMVVSPLVAAWATYLTYLGAM
jgi:hypothetical protein